MKTLSLIPVIIAAQLALVAAPLQPLDFRVPAGMPDAAQILSPADIQLDGWLGARVLANATNRLMTVDLEPLLAGHRHKPGSGPWVGEYIGKWLHAATLAWAYTGNPALRKRLDYAASELMKTQEPDGYLGTCVPEKRFGLYDGADWDVWSHKYCLLGLLTYYQFTGNRPARNVALNEWRWNVVKVSGGNHSAPEYAVAFDDSSWSTVKAGSGEVTIKTENTTAIYRARLTLTAEDLSGPGAEIHFTGCDDEGWYFVNGRYVGETHDWDAKPAFDITKFLRAGDNVVAVCCRNGGGQGGLNPNVTVDIIVKPDALSWSRSLFNGLAQVIVQSTKDAGEIKLTATAEGLTPATTTVNTQQCKLRPSLP